MWQGPSSAGRDLRPLMAATLRGYLRSLEPAPFRRRRGRFWERDFAAMSPREVSDAISGVLMVGGTYAFPMSTTTVPPGTRLYRVRHVPPDLVPAEADCWAPPPDRATGNRINRDGEPWLYTSMDLGSALSEMPVPAGTAAMVMTYEVREELRCSSADLRRGGRTRAHQTRAEQAADGQGLPARDVPPGGRRG